MHRVLKREIGGAPRDSTMTIVTKRVALLRILHPRGRLFVRPLVKLDLRSPRPALPTTRPMPKAEAAFYAVAVGKNPGLYDKKYVLHIVYRVSSAYIYGIAGRRAMLR